MSPSCPLIRRALVAEAEKLAELHHETVSVAYRHIFGPETAPPTADRLLAGWQELLSAEDGLVFLAELDAITVGSVVLAGDPNVLSGIVLKRLHVHPTHWGRGLGSTLHDHAIAEAQRRGFHGINLWVLEHNERARQMYERRGWILQPGHTIPNDPPHIIDVLYYRDVPFMA